MRNIVVIVVVVVFNRIAVVVVMPSCIPIYLLIGPRAKIVNQAAKSKIACKLLQIE